MPLPISGNPNLSTIRARMLGGRPSLPGLRRAYVGFTTEDELLKIAERCVEADRTDGATANEFHVIALAHSGKWFEQLIIVDQVPEGMTAAQIITDEVSRRMEYFRKESGKPARSDAEASLDQADFMTK